MGLIATLMTTWFIVGHNSLVASAAVTPLTDTIDFDVFGSGNGCVEDAKISSGSVTYLGVLDSTADDAEGSSSFCENSIAPIDAFNNGTMVETPIYTKVTIISCDAVQSMGYAFVDAFLCYDTACSNCEKLPIGAQLNLPDYEPYPNVDSCWGITGESSQATTLQKFTSTSNSASVEKYWNLWTEQSCIGSSMSIDEPAAAVPATPAATEVAAAKAAESSSSMTRATVTTTAAVMLLSMVASLN